MSSREVLVIGAGIAGLTSAAILSKLGLSVTLIESHTQSGGCAGTFKRKGYIFDVGATQVAGLEQGGIHSRIFNFLGIQVPQASVLNPSCIVDLDDGSRPIHIWHNSDDWVQERIIQFPNSENFWNLCSLIHQSNWKFANNQPVLPVRSKYDFLQFIKALNFQNFFSGVLIKSSMFDLLKLCGCAKDSRLINFLNLQLKLYSQKDVYNTAALYGCTVLQMSQNPHGLWHLNKSMQSLSDSLEESLNKTNARIIFGQKVKNICFDNRNSWKICAYKKDKLFEYFGQDVVYTPPPQSLLKNLEDDLMKNINYKSILEDLPKPSGAIVFYSALASKDVKNIHAHHYQLKNEELGSVFISISAEGDGRAPKGEVTLIASVFSDTDEWFNLDKNQYLDKKNSYLNKISNILEDKLKISSDTWLHRELATPYGFQKWTNRPKGIVGGLGQTPDSFGLFGLASRTPFKGLWLCGDSIHPGEGTAGVSQSALMVAKQIVNDRGMQNFDL